MAISTSTPSKTEEIRVRKISLTKLATINGKPKNRGVIGLESAPPQIGYSYVVHLEGERILMTSAIEDIRETDTGFTITTTNSVYQVKYQEPQLADKFAAA